MNSISKLCIVILIGLSCHTGVCQADEPQEYSDCSQHIISVQGDYHNSCSLDVIKGTNQAIIELAFDLNSGTAHWGLRDPQGIIQKEGQAGAWNVLIEKHTIDQPQPGSWTLEFNFEDAEGEYSIFWKVK